MGGEELLPIYVLCHVSRSTPYPIGEYLSSEARSDADPISSLTHHLSDRLSRRRPPGDAHAGMVVQDGHQRAIKAALLVGGEITAIHRPQAVRRFCRKVRFLSHEFNDIQTPKLSKKPLCDRTTKRQR